jgi:hypothetical protein
LGTSRFVNDFTLPEITSGMKVWEERCNNRDATKANARAIAARGGSRLSFSLSAAQEESWGET